MRLLELVGAAVLCAGCRSPAPGTKGKPNPAGEGPRILVGSTLDCSRLVRHVKPAYPREARRLRVEGTVRIRAKVGKDGSVHVLNVVSGDPRLVGAGVDSVKQWRYEPCRLNGEPVEYITHLDVNFTLSQ